MKTLLTLALISLAATGAFAAGPTAGGSSHALNGYSHDDLSVVMVTSPTESQRVWLVADHSYPLLLAERDKLLTLLEGAAKKIEIAAEHKTTLSYRQVLGGFYTDNADLVTVSFDTTGYESSYTVVGIKGKGNYAILLLNRKDTRDLIDNLGNVRSLVDDYQRQLSLFE
jgi:hypothetical protein